MLHFDELKLNNVPCSVLIGNFDGVHLGHQNLIENFVEQSKKRNLKSILITFEPHPFIFLKKDSTRYLIDSYERKHEKLQKLNIDSIVKLVFDEKLQCLDADTFITNLLDSLPDLKLVQLGHDFKLGKGKLDAKEKIHQMACLRNIEVLEKESFEVENQIVSSSVIRTAISKNLSMANKLLGHNFSIEGIVVGGKGIGRNELVPTANINIQDIQLLPSLGVYATRIYIDGISFEGVTNIGINPTIDKGNPITIENHIFHFGEDIYNKKISLEFISKLREEKKFNSFEELKNQIDLDILKAKNIFRETSNIKLALIGKEIAHSQSQKMYENLFKKSVNYTLIDCSSENEIPSIESLRNQFMGVSITSPYKEHFLSCTKTEPRGLIAVNALAFRDKDNYSTNTDYLAILEILRSKQYKDIDEFYLLGDGVMSKITQMIFKELGLSFKVLSRRNKLLDQVDKLLEGKKSNTLVINTCSRNYCFSKTCIGDFRFWDMNYKLDHHTELFKKTSIQYSDGMEQLHLQAKYALSFWNLKTI